MFIDVTITLVIIPSTIFSIIRFLATKGRKKEDMAFLVVPSVAALIVLLTGIVVGSDYGLPSMSVAFACFACALSILDSKTKAIMLIPYFAAVIAMAATSHPILISLAGAVISFSVLISSYVRRFGDIKNLVKKQALSMLISDWMSAILASLSLLVAAVSLALYWSDDQLWIIVRVVLSAVACVTFQILYLRCLHGRMLFLAKDRVSDIENHTLTYVRNDIVTNADDSSRQIYQRVHDYVVVKKNYLNPNLSEPEVARAVYVNKAYVGRAILKFTGMNYCTYVGKYRVEHAMQLFETDMSLRAGQLALQSGFKNEASMNVIFQNVTGMKPTEWMAMRRAQTKK